MKLINLFGAPGAGKTTTAHGLMHLMRLDGINVEFAPEYAKDLVYDGDLSTLSNQRLVSTEQYKRIKRLKDGADFVITDSPILLGNVYKIYGKRKHTKNLTANLSKWHNEFNNINFYLTRHSPYVQTGRLQNEQESDRFGWMIRGMLDMYCSDGYTVMPSDCELVYSEIKRNVLTTYISKSKTLRGDR